MLKVTLSFHRDRRAEGHARGRAGQASPVAGRRDVRPRNRSKLRALHFEPISDTRADIDAFIASERSRLGSVIEKMGGAIE